MRKVLAVLFTVAAVSTITSAAVIPFRAGDVSVTASYKGKGPVDEAHEILVFLFDHPTPSASSEPLAVQTITKNGGTATFKGVSADPVYVSLVYDEQSNYDGRSGPPPSGAPIGAYMKDGKPVAIKPGPTAKITVTFDDSRRWK